MCTDIAVGKQGNEIRIKVSLDHLEETYTNFVVQLRKNPCIDFCYSTDEGVVFDETESEVVIPRSVSTKLKETYGYGIIAEAPDSEIDLIYEGRVYIDPAWARA